MPVILSTITEVKHANVQFSYVELTSLITLVQTALIEMGASANTSDWQLEFDLLLNLVRAARNDVNLQLTALVDPIDGTVKAGMWTEWFE